MRSLVKALARARWHVRPNSRLIVVVSGLPRSGTSMMMRMLDAGGLSVLTDGLREADTDNPRGYYELQDVKDLEDEGRTWIRQADGKAVKVISELLKSLPSGFRYRVIFMLRDLSEILASQRVMLRHRGVRTTEQDDRRMATLYGKHLAETERWLAHHSDHEVLYVNYVDVIDEPEREARRVREFLQVDLDVREMAAVVDPILYRQRRDDLTG